MIAAWQGKSRRRAPGAARRFPAEYLYYCSLYPPRVARGPHGDPEGAAGPPHQPKLRLRIFASAKACVPGLHRSQQQNQIAPVGVAFVCNRG